MVFVNCWFGHFDFDFVVGYFDLMFVCCVVRLLVMFVGLLCVLLDLMCYDAVWLIMRVTLFFCLVVFLLDDFVCFT